MIRIGKIVAAHGLQGAVILTHIVGHSDWLKKEMPLFIELNKGSYIPYFTEQFRAANDEEYIVNLEEVTQVEQAKKLVGKQVYAQENLLEHTASDSPLLWIGFEVTDRKHGKLGKIDDVMLTANQWLAQLTYKDAEVLIPLIEQTIEGIDLKKKKIAVNLPEGLLEVYTK
ncbi:MAG: 16S rRNA processing protein RimM [Flavipsychrobacter sp.]|nr:16S rRNA processing protein RimM [Flavipsychrobacter sp.]